MSTVQRSKKTRRNNPRRQVADKLPVHLKHQIVLDFEKYCADTWTQFRDRKLRKEYCAGSLVGAAQNRFLYLKSLKVHTPEKYWPLVAQASAAVSGSAGEEEDSPDEFGEEDSIDESVGEEEPGEEEIYQTPIKLTSPAKSTKKKITPQQPKFQTPPRDLKSPHSELKSFRSRSDLKMAPRAPPSTASTSRTGQGPAEFGSIDEARLDADYVVEVDFNKPEKNGAPMFYLQEIVKVKSTDGKCLIWKAKIWANNLVDLRDFELTKGTVVCEGLGFMVKLPAVPYFRRNEKSIKEFNETKEAVRCSRTEEDYLGNVLSIASDPERLMIKYLFVMPDGYVVSANMESELSPNGDQKCKLFIRDHSEQYETGKDAKKKTREQTWYIGYWMLRIVSMGTCPLQNVADESDSDLEDGFSGMKI
jgi:hypothetical protein